MKRWLLLVVLLSLIVPAITATPVRAACAGTGAYNFEDPALFTGSDPILYSGTWTTVTSFGDPAYVYVQTTVAGSYARVNVCGDYMIIHRAMQDSSTAGNMNICTSISGSTPIDCTSYQNGDTDLVGFDLHNEVIIDISGLSYLYIYLASGTGPIILEHFEIIDAADPTATAINTSTPFVPVPTATILPSSTPFVPVPTATILPSSTPGVPTATAINTSTPAPTWTLAPSHTPPNTPVDTATILPSSTPGVPTATILPSSTPIDIDALLTLIAATPGDTPTPTNTPTETNTPTATYTPTPEPRSCATMAPGAGTPTGQLACFEYTATAGDVHIGNVLSLINYSVWAFFLFAVFLWRRRKK
jgi:hypothetical protein